MAIKWNYVWGTTTIVVIIGGTIYAIVKSKQAEKLEEQAISLSEAREIVANGPGEEREAEYAKALKDIIENGNGVDLDGDVVDGKYVHHLNNLANIEVLKQEHKISATLFTPDDDEEELEDEEDDEEMDLNDPLYDKYKRIDERTESPSIEPLKDFMYYEEGIDPKEDEELRHEPNSVAAKHQFIRMELADWTPQDDVYRIMLQLFEFAFVPTTDGDDVLRTKIIDYKVQFFGFNSRWNKEVSYADVIFHYARCAEFECGENVRYWVEYFLEFNDLEQDSTSRQIDTLLLRLNSHTYFNEERHTFGLFGLTRESMDQAIRIANMNIDRSVTYEIEFNEFLKSCV